MEMVLAYLVVGVIVTLIGDAQNRKSRDAEWETPEIVMLIGLWPIILVIAGYQAWEEARRGK